MKIIARGIGGIVLCAFPYTSYAVNCPSGTIFHKVSGQPYGECLCPSGERPVMNMASSNVVSIGGCSLLSSSSVDMKTPLFIESANLRLWLDSSDISATGAHFSNNTALSSTKMWRDKSNSANSFIPVSTLVAPTYLTNQLNNLPLVRFTSDYLYSTTAYTQATNGLTVFAVVSLGLLPAGNPKPTIISYGSDPTTGWALYIDNSMSNRPTFTVNRGTPWGENSARSPMTVTVNRYYVLTGWTNGELTRLYVNGVMTQDIGGGSANISYGASPALAIGGIKMGAGYVGNFTGDIAEVIYYSTALGAGHREQIEDYLSRKWGVYADPRDVSPGDLFLWLDANDPLDNGTLPANNASMADWHDRSGLNSDATIIVSSRNPTFKQSALNGKPVYSFDGNDTLISTGSYNFVPTNSHTVCFVGRVTSNSVGNKTFVAAYDAASIGTDIWTSFLYNPPGNRFMVDSLSYYDINNTPSNSSEVGVFKTVCVVNRHNAEAYLYHNGSLVGSQTTYSVPPAWVANRISVGSLADRDFLTGEIAEVVVYDVFLDYNTRRVVERYLNNKWAIK